MPRPDPTEPTPSTNLITYYRNYSTSDTIYQTYDGAELVSIETLGFSTPTGYFFKEWNTLSTGNGDSYVVGAAYPSGTVYAIWELNVDYLTTTSELTSVANAIRAKKGLNSSLLYPTEFISTINSIPNFNVSEFADPHGGTVMRVSSENYGYQPVEWLKSTDGIGVGFQTKKTMEFECKFYRESAGAQYLYVSDSGSSLTTNTTAYLSSSGGNWRFGNQTTSPNPSVTTLHTSIQNSTGLKIDGTTVGTYGAMSDFTSTFALRIFSSVDSAVTRIYYLKVKDNGTLIHHFVPAKDLNTGKYGFFDTVNWKFYTNDSATISHGDDISDPIVINAISKVSIFGTTAIDLTSDTVTAASMLSGVTAHDAAGDAITGTIATKTSSDMTVSGATVTAPAGYYASSASKSVASGSATTPATTITSQPAISVSSSGLITATNSKTQSVTPTVSSGYVSSGTAGTITVSGSNTQQLTTKAATTYTPGTTNQTIASGTYLTGAQTISGDANLVAANIAQGVSIFGVQGSHVGGLDISVTRVSDGQGHYKLQITNN